MNSLLGSRPGPPLVSWEIGSGVEAQFEVEARRDGSKFIEAQHMLLALAANPDSDAARLLNECGLDHERLVGVLAEEHRRTLAFAGMSDPDRNLVKPTELDSRVSLGTSAKAALRRSLILSHGNRRRRLRLRAIDLLAGILQAEFGTVPRALAIAGVDRAALIARTLGLTEC